MKCLWPASKTSVVYVQLFQCVLDNLRQFWVFGGWGEMTIFHFPLSGICFLPLTIYSRVAKVGVAKPGWPNRTFPVSTIQIFLFEQEQGREKYQWFIFFCETWLIIQRSISDRTDLSFLQTRLGEYRYKYTNILAKQSWPDCEENFLLIDKIRKLYNFIEMQSFNLSQENFIATHQEIPDRNLDLDKIILIRT